jgi:hypothetical protein
LEKLKHKFDHEIGTLKSGEEEIKERIGKTEVEKTFL